MLNIAYFIRPFKYPADSPIRIIWSTFICKLLELPKPTGRLHSAPSIPFETSSEAPLHTFRLCERISAQGLSVLAIRHH